MSSENEIVDFYLLIAIGGTCIFVIQWNPSITDTFGDQHFVRYSKVSPTQGLTVYFR